MRNMNGIGLWVPLRQGFKITYGKAGGIKRWMIIEAMFSMDMITVKYTEKPIPDWEELETAVEHFNFIQKYL